MIYKEKLGDVTMTYEGTPKEIKEMINNTKEKVIQNTTNVSLNLRKLSEEEIKELTKAVNNNKNYLTVIEDAIDNSKHINEQNNIEELCKPIVEYLKDNYNPYCELVITSDSIKLNETRIGIPIENNEKSCVCDGKFEGRTSYHPPCEVSAKYIARSNIDPIGCVYYCCTNCRHSYEEEGFIVEKI